jgi:hypothetical protein
VPFDVAEKKTLSIWSTLFDSLQVSNNWKFVGWLLLCLLIIVVSLSLRYNSYFLGRSASSSPLLFLAGSRLRGFESSGFQTTASSRLRDFVSSIFQIFASSLLLKTYVTNFINLDVSRVTGFFEFPNTCLPNPPWHEYIADWVDYIINHCDAISNFLTWPSELKDANRSKSWQVDLVHSKHSRIKLC